MWGRLLCEIVMGLGITSEQLDESRHGARLEGGCMRIVLMQRQLNQSSYGSFPCSKRLRLRGCARRASSGAGTCLDELVLWQHLSAVPVHHRVLDILQQRLVQAGEDLCDGRAERPNVGRHACVRVCARVRVRVRALERA